MLYFSVEESGNMFFFSLCSHKDVCGPKLAELVQWTEIQRESIVLGHLVDGGHCVIWTMSNGESFWG